jgi:hypothetical protein
MTKKQPVQKQKSSTPQREIFHLYDAILKALLSLSDRLVILCINALFNANHPLDSKVVHLDKEFSHPILGRRLADCIILINNIAYHIEIQAHRDSNIVIRMFEYGLLYAEATRTVKPGLRVLQFPQPRIIQIKGSAPALETVRLLFADESEHDFTVPTFNLPEYTLKELEEKDLLLLLPIYASKYEEVVREAQSTGEWKEAAAIMDTLLEGIYGVIDRAKGSGKITKDDARGLLNSLRYFYEGLYGQYKELAKGVKTMDGKIKFYSDILVEEAVKKAEK